MDIIQIMFLMVGFSTFLNSDGDDAWILNIIQKKLLDSFEISAANYWVGADKTNI